MNLTETAWIAGLLEGEGCFQGGKGNGLTISCTMTDLDVLERLRNFCGGRIIKQRERQPHWKQTWRWGIHGRQALGVLMHILPLMGKRRTEKILEVVAIYKSSPRFVAKENQREVKRLVDEGLTHQQVANKLGISRSYVTHIVSGRYN